MWRGHAIQHNGIQFFVKVIDIGNIPTSMVKVSVRKANMERIKDTNDNEINFVFRRNERRKISI